MIDYKFNSLYKNFLGSNNIILNNSLSKKSKEELLNQYGILYEISNKSKTLVEVGFNEGVEDVIMLMCNSNLKIIGFQGGIDDNKLDKINTINKYYDNRYEHINNSINNDINSYSERDIDCVFINKNIDYHNTYSIIKTIVSHSKDGVQIILNSDNNQAIRICNTYKNNLTRYYCGNSYVIYKMKNSFKSNIPTIVTAIYNIRKMEQNYEPYIKDINFYLDQGKFITELPYNMIIFTEDDLYDNVYNMRKKYIDRTVIIPLKFEDTYFYKDYDVLHNLKNVFHIKNIGEKKDTVRYVILNNNKFDFMERSIKLNPFSSTHFLWIDFGITHVASEPHTITRWITSIPNKVRQMVINPYIEKEQPKEYFQYTRHNVSGGLFSGSKAYLLNYIATFKKMYDKILIDNWYQLDEAVMSMVIKEYPELFDCYYGDYTGIICNYDIPTSCFDMINSSLCKCLEFKNYSLANHIINYLLPYHKYNDYYVNNIIEYIILVDYYITENHCLRKECLKIIDRMLDKGQKINQSHINTLKFHINNIRFYSNTSSQVDRIEKLIADN